MRNKFYCFIMIVFAQTSVFGEPRTIGLFVNDTANVYKGYTLFAPKQNTMTYLINNEGRIIHQWTASQYPPGQSVYLLENGHLLRTCMTTGNVPRGRVLYYFRSEAPLGNVFFRSSAWERILSKLRLGMYSFETLLGNVFFRSSASFQIR